MKVNIFKKLYFPLLLLILTTHLFGQSEDTTSSNDLHYPAPLLSLDGRYTHHVLVAEKSTHLLYLYKNKSGIPELIKTYQMVTGKKTGDKLNEGDLKTPEGIYQFIDFMTHKELMTKSGPTGIIYGAGAFVMNYPNPYDDKMGKGGSGIWLHSTNDEARLDRGLDSRGCVVTANNDLIDLSKYIELHKTPIVVVQDLFFLSEKSFNVKKTEIEKMINGWLAAWRSKNIEEYMSYYHPTDFTDIRGNFNKYRTYKAAVFSNPGKPKIDFENVSILATKDYAVVNFTQKYQSSTINDTGKKTLYLKLDANYNWKIINEIWSEKGFNESDKVAFSPSLRFFKDDQYNQHKKEN